MGLMDALLITLTSGVACVVLPRSIALILAHQTNHIKPVNQGLKSVEFRQKITTFPYCTSYMLRKNTSCKFSPHFCAQCSVMS